MSNQRKQIWDKSQGKCWYCGCDLPKRWHVDHFKPLGRNPDGTCNHPENDTFDNLVPSCASCNLIKADMDLEMFRWTISNFITRLNRDIAVYRHARRFGLVKETGKEVKFWFEENEHEQT